MQHQQITNTENLPYEVTNEGLNIDFDNVEDILDFSARPSPEAANQETPKQRPPQRHKRTAEKPVRLFEIIPLIDDFVNNEEEYYEDEEGCETEVSSKRRFRCVYCGNKFIRSSHLRRHLYSHTGAKPYFCQICRKRFSRSDYVLIHTQSHYRNKVHFCCVCGKLYLSLAIFAEHCHSHSDTEYIRIAMSNTVKESEAEIEQRQLQIAQDPLLAATCAKEIESLSCVKVEVVDNSIDEEHIMYIENPIYSSHHHQMQPIPMYNNGYTMPSVFSNGSLSNSVSLCNTLMAPTNIVPFVPQ